MLFRYAPSRLGGRTGCSPTRPGGPVPARPSTPSWKPPRPMACGLSRISSSFWKTCPAASPPKLVCLGTILYKHSANNRLPLKTTAAGYFVACVSSALFDAYCYPQAVFPNRRVLNSHTCLSAFSSRKPTPRRTKKFYTLLTPLQWPRQGRKERRFFRYEEHTSELQTH